MCPGGVTLRERGGAARRSGLEIEEGLVAARREATPTYRERTPRAPQFPGCRPVSLKREDIATYEGRLEFWDAATETAWVVCEPAGMYHEHPSQRLRELMTMIAQARGSPIETFGSADLLTRDARGEYRRILQADQTVYLRPRETRPWGDAIEVGSDVLPDVVLEVDHTTDVRRGKLGFYESWGFPEVWVEVPDHPAPSRPVSLRPGLTIHVREGEGYRAVASSRAFPGWTARQIHRALNERELSGETVAELRRLGRAMGAADGTGPDDHPFLREERGESRAAGWAEGRTEALPARPLRADFGGAPARGPGAGRADTALVEHEAAPVGAGAARLLQPLLRAGRGRELPLPLGSRRNAATEHQGKGVPGLRPVWSSRGS